MKATTIRFGELQWRFIAMVADNEGVSAGQFIREAAFGRAILQWATAADPENVKAMQQALAGEHQPEALEKLLNELYPDA